MWNFNFDVSYKGILLIIEIGLYFLQSLSKTEVYIFYSHILLNFNLTDF